MNQDKEGFAAPEIDSGKCIKCMVCTKKCPQLNKVKLWDVEAVYAMKNLDLEKRQSSSSGGVFVELAEQVLDESDGVVVGCAFVDMRAKHICISSVKELCLLQGSKYVQSDVSEIYGEIKAYLDNSRKVLFSGTPCQIAGLKSFLGGIDENLITVDLVCHGVPSPLLFEKYILWLEKKRNGKVANYSFRNKENSKFPRFIKIHLEVNKKIKSIFIAPRRDSYFRAFLNNETFRESCYSCKFSNKKRIGDITLGDYWGLRKYHPELYDRNGISVVLINTDKGNQLFDLIRERFELIESNYTFASAANDNLVRPSTRPEARNIAYIGIQEDGFNIFDNAFYKISLADRIKGFLKFHITMILPSGFVDFVRAKKRRR
jgi:coenzyme F420-reducing hydrogenase beta subunit